ncbi:phage tail length tape measure family protein [Rhizobium sp. Root483D2]|uniref:phage tail length tape measure family protein n=1 Tax=Rhizobium sp. Root483D2 TaxID=1736545 RepID=UPI000712581D|nr:phage tail length tape measure family protein [Rhizobium sp. Root483D2]KQY20225.1 hypothetical protein ASD32_07100 [Rhizobium sp. Root483D2]
MSDVAQLGIQVTNKGVKENTDGLDKLSGAAARAEAATDGLSGANRGAVGAASAAAKAYSSEGAAAASASKQIEMANRAANQNTAGLARTHDTANLAAQGFDIVTTAAGGMQAGLIGMQQGLQIAQVAMMSNGSFAKELGGSLLAMLSPITLIAVGLTTLVAVLIQSVSWAKLAQSALNALAEILDEIAPYAVGAAAALALLYAPAIIGGIISVIALLGRLAVAAVTAGAAMLAANPAGAIVLGIVAAVAAANIFRDELAQIFGRDIVADAKAGVNFIIGAFVGGFNGIKAIWGMLPSVLGDLVYATVAAVIGAIESMINSAIGGINNLINEAKMASLKIGVPLNVDFVSAISIEKPANPYAGATGKAAAKLFEEMKAAQGTDYVGGVTDAIAKGASAASEKLKELAKGLTDVDAKAKKKTGGKSDTEKYSDIVDGAERRIAALDAKRNALGLSEEAAAALRYETDLLNQAQQRGITLSAAQKGELSALAQVMAQTEAETKKMGLAIEFSKDLTKGFFDDFFSSIESGKSVWESFGDAALGVLSKISDKLLNDVVDALFEVNNAGAGSGGGILSGILGLFGGGQMGIAKAGGVGLYAAGTPAARPGVAWVGEKGPELVRFKGGEEVIPNHKLKASNNNRGAANSNEAPVHVSFAPVYNVQGYGQDIEGLKTQMNRDRQEFKARVVDTVRKAKNSRDL